MAEKICYVLTAEVYDEWNAELRFHVEGVFATEAAAKEAVANLKHIPTELEITYSIQRFVIQ